MIATLTWRWKRKRDLQQAEEKQRQEIRITAEETASVRRQAAKERLEQLGLQRDAFANQVAQVMNGHQLADLVDRYFQWLASNEIQHLPENLKTLSENPRLSSHLRNATSPDVRGIATKIEACIRNTELPPPGE